MMTSAREAILRMLSMARAKSMFSAGGFPSA